MRLQILDPERRVWDRLEVGDCWVWTAGRDRYGYGVVHFGYRTFRVHRVVWERLVGPIPAGLHLDHLCRNRACANPDHLQPVTHAENVARGIFAAGKPRLASCRKGHPWTPGNTKYVRGNVRTCRECARAADRAYKARKRAAA